MIYSLFNVLAELTPEQLRAQAKSYRAAAEQNTDYPESCVSYRRLAERCEEMADACDADLAGDGRHQSG